MLQQWLQRQHSWASGLQTSVLSSSAGCFPWRSKCLLPCGRGGWGGGGEEERDSALCTFLSCPSLQIQTGSRIPEDAPLCLCSLCIFPLALGVQASVCNFNCI